MIPWVTAAAVGAGLTYALLPAVEKLCITPHTELDSRARLAAVGAGAACLSLVPAFGSLVAVGVMTVVFSSLFVVSAVDLLELRVPNRVVWPSTLLAAAVALGAALVGHDGGLAGLIGAASFASVIGLFHLARPAAMGLGDVKLAAFLGLVVGFHAASPLRSLELLGWTMVSASLIGLAMAVLRRSTAPLPFAPALSAAAWVVSVSTQLVIR